VTSVLPLPPEHDKPVPLKFFSRDTWSRCPVCIGSGICVTQFGTSTEYACQHCNGVGWLTPEGHRLREADAILFLRKSILVIRRMAPKPKAEQHKTSSPAGDYKGKRWTGD